MERRAAPRRRARRAPARRSSRCRPALCRIQRVEEPERLLAARQRVSRPPRRPGAAPGERCRRAARWPGSRRPARPGSPPAKNALHRQHHAEPRLDDVHQLDGGQGVERVVVERPARDRSPRRSCPPRRRHLGGQPAAELPRVDRWSIGDRRAPPPHPAGPARRRARRASRRGSRRGRRGAGSCRSTSWDGRRPSRTTAWAAPRAPRPPPGGSPRPRLGGVGLPVLALAPPAPPPAAPRPPPRRRRRRRSPGAAPGGCARRSARCPAGSGCGRGG